MSSHNLWATTPWSEPDRLAALALFAILDTPPEPAFDEIAGLAAQLCGVPMAQINLIDADRQWSKAQFGLEQPDLLLEQSLCAQTILRPDGLIVDDLQADPRFATHPLVVGAPGLRFYAGAVLLTAEGLPLGTLCVLDVQPRHLSERQVAALSALARQVVSQLELRRALCTQRESETRHQQQRLATQESQVRYRALVELSSQMVWLADAQGNVTYFNPYWYEYTGLDPNQPSPDWSSVVHPDQLEHFKAVWAVAQINVEPYCAEIQFAGADGRYRWFEERGTPVLAADGTLQHWVGVAVDIDERKRANHRQAFLLQLSDRLHDAVRAEDVVVNLGESLGSTLEVQRIGYGRFGIQGLLVIESEWLQRPSRSSRGLHRISEYGEGLLGSLSQGEMIIIEDVDSDPRTAKAARRYADYSIRSVLIAPLADDGHINALLYISSEQPRQWSCEDVALVREVADRTRAADERAKVRIERARVEQVMRASELQFRTLADNMSQLAWTAEPAGKIYWYNKRWYDYTGTSLEAMQALGWRSVHHPEHFQRVTARVKHCFATGSLWEDTFPLRGKDGNYSWFLSRALPIRDGLGHITHWLGTHTDITAQVNAEEALRDLNESLERRVAERTREMVTINELLQVEMSERESAEEALRHAQKMDAIGQLTGGIAHDFNNMLTGVLGALELIQRRVAAGRVGEIDRYINAAMTSANRAASLTHRLLAFARRQSLNPQAVDVNRMVRSMEELLRRTIGESIELHIDLRARLWQANTDEHQLENALLNLVINARDAMPEGGRLTIRTAVARIDVQQDALTPGEYVLLSVEDNGFGMSTEVIGRAFDPFFTTKPVGQGTGLGLSMVYGFIKQTGGHVQIDSVEQQGTRIHLYLPCHLQQGERHIAEPESPGTPRALKGEQVLVVEDEVAVRMLVTDVLRELGYSTLEACDSKTALAVLQGKARIDLLVSDVGLPGLNGRQLAEIARQYRPDLRVLFMTGHAPNAEVRADFLDQGMDMLIKPFSIDELALKVREIIEGERS